MSIGPPPPRPNSAKSCANYLEFKNKVSGFQKKAEAGKLDPFAYMKFLKNNELYVNYDPDIAEKLDGIVKTIEENPPKDPKVLNNIKGICQKRLVPPTEMSKDITQSVLSHLGPKDLANTAQVSKEWKSLSENERVGWINRHPHTGLKDIGLNNYKSVVKFVKTHGKALKNLNLTGFNITDTQLFELSRYCPDLTYARITSDTLTDITPLKQYKNLEELHLTNCSKLKNLEPITELTKLKTLDIAGCIQITKEDILASNTKARVMK